MLVTGRNTREIKKAMNQEYRSIRTFALGIPLEEIISEGCVGCMCGEWKRPKVNLLCEAAGSPENELQTTLKFSSLWTNLNK